MRKLFTLAWVRRCPIVRAGMPDTTRTRRWFAPALGGLGLAVVLIAGLLERLPPWVTGAPPSAAAVARTLRRRGAGDVAELPRLWRVPDFQGLTQDGRSIDARSLDNGTWIADFFYTSCTSACPMLTAKMMLLARKLDARTSLLSFSVDPAHDTPRVLASYRKRWTTTALPWTLVAVGADVLARLAEGMRVAVDRSDANEGQIVHSSHFFLIDREGWVRGIYDSLNEDNLASLVEDTARLTAGTPRPSVGSPLSQATGATGPPEGKRLFDDLGCGGCHNDARTAPALGGLARRTIHLTGGATILADHAYLRNSLLQPWEQVVAGYAATMPSYRDVLTERQIEEMISYLETLPTTPLRAPATAAIDPVCGMRVTVVDGTPTMQRDGETYYFCSDTCLERFHAEPSLRKVPQTGATRGTAAPR